MAVGLHVREGVYVTAEQYARKFRLSVATVKRRCAGGDLEAFKAGERTWFIRLDDGKTK